MDKKQVSEAFEKNFGEANELRFYFCPGRVCLIGEHLDYNGGHVLPAAISMGVYAAVAKGGKGILKCASEGFEEVVNIDLAEEIRHQQEDPWGNYIRGVVLFLQNNGVNIEGLNIQFYSDLPHGAGLSSSAAIEVLTAFILQTEAGLEVDLEETAVLCKEVENQFVGVNCGYMDQYAVALGKKDQALLLNCEDLSWQNAKIETGDYQFVIINSNQPRQLASSEFNQRKDECDEALRLLNQHREIHFLAQANADEIERHLSGDLRKRAIHVITENQRVLRSVKFLENGDVHSFGGFMNASHNSLKNNYEVTGKALDTIAENAIQLEGCIGARMTGAGFGGCAIALVHKDKMMSFQTELDFRYQNAVGKSLSFYPVALSKGVNTW
jgi:galactokinase